MNFLINLTLFNLNFKNIVYASQKYTGTSVDLTDFHYLAVILWAVTQRLSSLRLRDDPNNYCEQAMKYTKFSNHFVLWCK